MNGTHIMLDFETLGQRPSTVVLSLGAVMFDKTGLLKEQEWFFDPKEQLRKQRTIDFDTLAWWMQQSDEARQIFKREITVPMISFCEMFTSFVGNCDPKIWGNGSDFDVSIMAHLWKHHYLTDPIWKFWNVRCFRTFNSVTKCKDLVKMEGVKHSAIDDARYQARCVIASGLLK